MPGLIRERLVTGLAVPLGTLAVAVPFALVELWANLWHDPFRPRMQDHGWTIFQFSAYGAFFLAACGYAVFLTASMALGLGGALSSRRTWLGLFLAGGVLYALFHHSRHVLWYWEAGGSW